MRVQSVARGLLLWVCVATGEATFAQERSPARVQFNRDIRPILSDHCFACHGPDRNSRKAGLRLDVRAEALKRRVIVPGKPEQSTLIARIFSTGTVPIMPPPSAHKPLTARQKELLRRWIAQGAPYEAHWAFTPLPRHIPVPKVRNIRWVRNPIDAFVLARLEALGIAPSPEADRVTWLRRVTLDLTGLPPAPDDVDAFLADRSPDAYEKVVDRLLRSPRYGERMATPWLDVVRYADSYGYQSDQLSTTWPYRDWVVRAFNSNMPYDRFLTEQIAGDLLPSPTRDQRVATAFHRLHRMTNEGGSVPEEWRLEGVADRVNTFGMAFLGLTLECARCHDHKYDPVSMRDYYALSAFFNSIDEHGLYDRADIIPAPSMLLPNPEQEQNLSRARQMVEQREREWLQKRQEREPAFREWLASMQRSRATSSALPDLIGRFDFERFDGSTLRNLVPDATHHGARSEEVPLVPGWAGMAAQFDGENNVHFPELGRFGRHTPFTIAFWMRDPRQVQGAAVVFQACGGTDAGPHGYDLLVEQGVLTARLFRHWPGNAIAVRTRQAIPANTWTHVAVTYDGSSRAAGLRIYVNGRSAALQTVRDRMLKSIGYHTLVLGQRFRDRGFKGGQIDELTIFRRELTSLEVAHLVDGRSLHDALAAPQAHEAALRETYFSAFDPVMRETTQALASAREQLVAAEDACLELAVMEEMPVPRPTYVLFRGRYDAPRTEANRVTRITPAFLPPMPPGARKDRLGLAQWLTHPDHPLTARVAVNRFWALLFGRGLVETQEDFGVQGRLPTHPELLDWLARDFVRSGWDVHGLLRRIVLSSTYRQSSVLRPDLKERDPNNLLLARGPAFRLSAEAIRDLALFAGGLLDERIGGPPVSPYQPGDLWRETNVMSPPYRQSVGGDLYRRSLYTVWKRTAPMPNMVAFDAGSREVCTARRQTTNTPLQALVLLNDPQFVEAARALGQRALREAGPDDAHRVRFLFRVLATREPDPFERQQLRALLADQRARFQADPEAAKQLLQVGESKPDPDLAPVELAAMTVVAQTVLNLDATIWKR
ncbi:MAG: DUF1553 domain-containing protein [Chloroherpetonaceae bacterium]|nr:DUF1553 domain-containing protein [Chthonomonadaceae bacterium]MDW8208651.1 DUF1553 domain-containing protein [Chloroherpetonaceae bacterium]